MPHILLFFLLLACMACKKHSDDNPNPSDTLPPVDTIHHDTSWVKPTQDLVFYEVNMRAQGAAGTFTGFITQLDSLKALGTNTVWFMPIFPVGQLRSVPPLGSPYATQNYETTNPEFGTLAEFKEMVRQAHQRKLSIVLDWAANHTAWDHPWILAHPDWYTQNARGEIISPAGTNWQDVADLNFNNADMRLAMIASMKFWVRDLGIDGFRFDAANMIPSDFWKQAIDSLKAVSHPYPLIFLAEGDRADLLTSGFQLTYGWDFYTALKLVFKNGQTANRLAGANAAETATMPTGTYRLRFTTNHDQTAYEATPLALFGGKAGALAASAITMSMGGAPLLYNGQEVGCPIMLPIFSRSTIDWSANADMRVAYKQLLKTYNSTPAFRGGTIEYLPDVNVAAVHRVNGASQAVSLVNTRNLTVTYTIPTSLKRTAWTNQTGNPDTLKDTRVLPPYGYIWLKK